MALSAHAEGLIYDQQQRGQIKPCPPYEPSKKKGE